MNTFISNWDLGVAASDLYIWDWAACNTFNSIWDLGVAARDLVTPTSGIGAEKLLELVCNQNLRLFSVCRDLDLLDHTQS